MACSDQDAIHPRIRSACFYSFNKKRNVKFQHYQMRLLFFLKKMDLFIESTKKNSHRTFNIAIQFTLTKKRMKKQNRKMNNFGLAGKMGWTREWEIKKHASEIIRNELFKWNISILCSTKRLTADIALLWLFFIVITSMYVDSHNYSAKIWWAFPRFISRLISARTIANASNISITIRLWLFIILIADDLVYLNA